MKKFPILVGLATVLIIIIGVLILSRGNSGNALSLPNNYEFFYSSTCPHCKNVEDFLNSWDKKDKVKIDKFEVGTNSANATNMLKRSTYCKLPNDQIGAVPFLFTPDGKCLVGDEPIINFFQNLK